MSRREDMSMVATELGRVEPVEHGDAQSAERLAAPGPGARDPEED